jgi:Flp pilus assembly protein TadG
MTNRDDRNHEPRDRGSAAVEMVIVAPALIVLMLLVVGMGRLSHGDQQIQVAAAQAARAASLQRGDPAQVSSAANAAANDTLTGDHISCDHTATPVTIDPASVEQPGGSITVTLTCTTQLSDLLLAGFPGSHTWTATVTAPVDTFDQATP